MIEDRSDRIFWTWLVA